MSAGCERSVTSLGREREIGRGRRSAWTCSRGVLMVIGAYDPEVSGGGLQCRELVRILRRQIPFIVLAISSDPTLPSRNELDGVPVYRIAVDVNRAASRIAAGWRLLRTAIDLRDRFDVVHFHGVSQKTVPLMLLAKLLRKKTLLTLHTAGHDEPDAIRAKGRAVFWCSRAADRVAGVSPQLRERYAAAGLPMEKFAYIPNGVDLERFRSGDVTERRALRRQLGLPLELPLILFVGFFSNDKRPETLFQAWKRLQGNGVPAAGLVFVGSTRSRYFEVDPRLAQAIRAEVERLGAQERVIFVEVSQTIEHYFRCADIFVLPSNREGMPVALLEAMASGLPCVASRLPGVTDQMIDHGVNGLLVPVDDIAALAGALRWLLTHPDEARRLGEEARTTIGARYTIGQAAARYLETYQLLTGQGASR